MISKITARKVELRVSAIYLKLKQKVKHSDSQMLYAIFPNSRHWQNTTPASPSTRLFNYYSVVLFCNFLTMTSCRYTDITSEKCFRTGATEVNSGPCQSFIIFLEIYYLR